MTTDAKMTKTAVGFGGPVVPLALARCGRRYTLDDGQDANQS